MSGGKEAKFEAETGSQMPAFGYSFKTEQQSNEQSILDELGIVSTDVDNSLDWDSFFDIPVGSNFQQQASTAGSQEALVEKSVAAVGVHTNDVDFNGGGTQARASSVNSTAGVYGKGRSGAETAGRSLVTGQNTCGSGNGSSSPPTSLTYAELHQLCQEQKRDLKAQEKTIRNMRNMMSEEQELREKVRKRRDEACAEVDRFKRELSTLTLAHDTLSRSSESLQKEASSDKLMIQQLEAKVENLKFTNQDLQCQVRQGEDKEKIKLKEDLREQKRLIKKYERELDEKTAVIQQLRVKLTSLKVNSTGSGSSDSGIAAESDDDLRMVMSRLRADIISLRKDMSGPRVPRAHARSKRSTCDTSDTENDTVNTRSRPPSNYSTNDDCFDNLTVSSGSSVASYSPTHNANDLLRDILFSKDYSKRSSIFSPTRPACVNHSVSIKIPTSSSETNSDRSEAFQTPPSSIVAEKQDFAACRKFKGEDELVQVSGTFQQPVKVTRTKQDVDCQQIPCANSTTKPMLLPHKAPSSISTSSTLNKPTLNCPSLFDEHPKSISSVPSLFSPPNSPNHPETPKVNLSEVFPSEIVRPSKNMQEIVAASSGNAESQERVRKFTTVKVQPKAVTPSPPASLSAKSCDYSGEVVQNNTINTSSVTANVSKKNISSSSYLSDTDSSSGDESSCEMDELPNLQVGKPVLPSASPPKNKLSSPVKSSESLGVLKCRDSTPQMHSAETSRKHPDYSLQNDLSLSSDDDSTDASYDSSSSDEDVPPPVLKPQLSLPSESYTRPNLKVFLGAKSADQMPSLEPADVPIRAVERDHKRIIVPELKVNGELSGNHSQQAFPASSVLTNTIPDAPINLDPVDSESLVPGYLKPKVHNGVELQVPENRELSSSESLEPTVPENEEQFISENLEISAPEKQEESNPENREPLDREELKQAKPVQLEPPVCGNEEQSHPENREVLVRENLEQFNPENLEPPVCEKEKQSHPESQEPLDFHENLEQSNPENLGPVCENEEQLICEYLESPIPEDPLPFTLQNPKQAVPAHSGESVTSNMSISAPQNVGPVPPLPVPTPLSDELNIQRSIISPAKGKSREYLLANVSLDKPNDVTVSNKPRTKKPLPGLLPVKTPSIESTSAPAQVKPADSKRLLTYAKREECPGRSSEAPTRTPTIPSMRIQRPTGSIDEKFAASIKPVAVKRNFSELDFSPSGCSDSKEHEGFVVPKKTRVSHFSETKKSVATLSSEVVGIVEKERLSSNEQQILQKVNQAPRKPENIWETQPYSKNKAQIGSSATEIIKPRTIESISRTFKSIVDVSQVPTTTSSVPKKIGINVLTSQHVKTPVLPSCNKSKTSARDKIRSTLAIVPVGSGENICDKKRLEIFAQKTAERRRAEKQLGEAAQGPSPIQPTRFEGVNRTTYSSRISRSSATKPPVKGVQAETSTFSRVSTMGSAALSSPERVEKSDLPSLDRKSPVKPKIPFTMSTRNTPTRGKNISLEESSLDEPEKAEPSRRKPVSGVDSRAKLMRRLGIKRSSVISNKPTASKFLPKPTAVIPPKIVRTAESVFSDLEMSSDSDSGSSETSCLSQTKQSTSRSAEQTPSISELSVQSLFGDEDEPFNNNPTALKQSDSETQEIKNNTKKQPQPSRESISSVELPRRIPARAASSSAKASIEKNVQGSQSSSRSTSMENNTEGDNFPAPPMPATEIPASRVINNDSVAGRNFPVSEIMDSILSEHIESRTDETNVSERNPSLRDTNGENNKKRKVKPPPPEEQSPFKRLLFGKHTRTLTLQQVKEELKIFLATNEPGMSCLEYSRKLHQDLQDFIRNSYFCNKANQGDVISECRTVCEKIRIVQSLRPALFKELQSATVVCFIEHYLANTAMCQYKRNEILNQLGVCYGTICREFKLPELAFQMLDVVLTKRPPQKHVFAHGLTLAYPDLWTVPFDFANLLEKSMILSLLYGPLYTNCIYFKNLRQMMVEGLELALPDCNFKQAFMLIWEEVKDLEFQSAIEEGRRALLIPLLQCDWNQAGIIMQEVFDVIYREWQEMKITDKILGTFFDVIVSACELTRSREPNFPGKLVLFDRMNSSLAGLDPSRHVAHSLKQSISVGIIRLNHLIERGPNSEPELEVYTLEEEKKHKKLIAKIEKSHRRRYKRFKQAEEKRGKKANTPDD